MRTPLTQRGRFGAPVLFRAVCWLAGGLLLGWARPAAAQSQPLALRPVIAENCGGDTVGLFRQDTSFGDFNSSFTGQTYSTSAPVSVAGVRNAAPARVYQSERYGNPTLVYLLAGINPDFSPRLAPGVAYLVRLHFAEIWFTQAGQRQFNVSINGQRVLTDFDIVAEAGGPNKAVVKEFTATAAAVRGGPGGIRVDFTRGAADNPKISGIEILPVTLFQNQRPNLTDFTEGRSYELGTRFQASTAGDIRALRYWRAPSDTGPHVGRVWNAQGQQLAQATFVEPTGPATQAGWQEVALPTPLRVRAGATYTVSVNINSHYVSTVGGLQPPVSNGYLASQGAGVYGNSGTFPTSTYQNSNYFRDVVFVASPTPPPVTLFTTEQPSLPDATDGRPYELGAKFQTTAPGQVQAIRYWRAPSDAGPHVGRLWTASGTLLDSVVFANETASGWQRAALTQPRPLAANTTYVVTVNANSHYAFALGGLAGSVGAGPVRTVADGNNGVYGDLRRLPTSSYQNSNYFRDVEFAPDSGGVVTPPATLPPFVHRSYLGWMTDLASAGRPNDAWPSIGIDQNLVNDYDEAYANMQATGLNEVAIWGFFTSREWSVDVENTIDATRAAQVRDLIARAHARGLKVVVGLGLFSWGFDAIIRSEPGLSDGQNTSAMCASNPRSWYWQKRVVDYVFGFGVDGVTMQSGDQGRCRAPQDAQLSDVAYHALLNDSIAAYIKRTHPGALVGVNGYGVPYGNPADLPDVVRMTRHADYLIDVGNVGGRASRAYRQGTLVPAIAPCQYGTLSVPFTEPPQHWDRERWFLPNLRRAATHLQELAADGGRAVENFMRPLANPGDEASIKLLAAVELNPSANWQTQLRQILQSIYQPADATALDDLTAVFLRAEDAYFNNAGNLEIISLEPLVGNSVGPPVYLRDHMNAAQLANYKAEICALQQLATGLVSRVGNQARMQTVVRCLGRVLDDVNTVSGNSAPCPTNRSALLAGRAAPAASQLAVYPNPARTTLTVQTATGPLQGATLTLRDAYGRRVRARTVEAAGPAVTLDVAGLAEGLYFLTVDSAAGRVVQKVEVRP